MKTEYLVIGGAVVVGGAAFFLLRKRPGLPPVIAPKSGCEKVVDKGSQAAIKSGNPYAVVGGVAASALSDQLCKGATWALKKGLQGAKAGVKFVGKEAVVVGKAVGSTASLYGSASYQQTIMPLKMVQLTALSPIKTTKSVARAVVGAPGQLAAVAKDPKSAIKTLANPIAATKAVKNNIKKVFGF